MTEHKSDIDQLREKHAGDGWQIGSMWTAAASGPDRRQLWAQRAGVLLTAHSAAGLSEAIHAAERG